MSRLLGLGCTPFYLASSLLDEWLRPLGPSFLLSSSHYLLPLATSCTTTTMTTEATETNPPPLESITPACFACKAPGIQRCSGCENARYCSEKCQKSDWRFHKHLCKAFNELGPRPGLTYYRGILFPRIQPSQASYGSSTKREQNRGSTPTDTRARRARKSLTSTAFTNLAALLSTNSRLCSLLPNSRSTFH